MAAGIVRIALKKYQRCNKMLLIVSHAILCVMAVALCRINAMIGS